MGRVFLDEIRKHAPEAKGVGGLTLGADPLASAVSTMSWIAGWPIPAFIVRKEPKGHGTGAWIEGLSALEKGATVAIVEDVVTTGGSSLKAVERAELEGLKVAAIFALVDRLEGGREAIEAKGYTLHTLFTRRDFIP